MSGSFALEFLTAKANQGTGEEKYNAVLCLIALAQTDSRALEVLGDITQSNQMLDIVCLLPPGQLRAVLLKHFPERVIDSSGDPPLRTLDYLDLLAAVGDDETARHLDKLSTDGERSMVLRKSLVAAADRIRHRTAKTQKAQDAWTREEVDFLRTYFLMHFAGDEDRTLLLAARKTLDHEIRFSADFLKQRIVEGQSDFAIFTPMKQHLAIKLAVAQHDLPLVPFLQSIADGNPFAKQAMRELQGR